MGSEEPYVPLTTSIRWWLWSFSLDDVSRDHVPSTSDALGDLRRYCALSEVYLRVLRRFFLVSNDYLSDLDKGRMTRTPLTFGFDALMNASTDIFTTYVPIGASFARSPMSTLAILLATLLAHMTRTTTASKTLQNLVLSSRVYPRIPRIVFQIFQRTNTLWCSKTQLSIIPMTVCLAVLLTRRSGFLRVTLIARSAVFDI